MYEESTARDRSVSTALRLYDRWTRERQKRPPIRSTDDPKELPTIAAENFKTQLVEPRRRQLKELKDSAKSISFSDQAALLVSMELPVLETSTLLHRLARQVAEDQGATYFSKTNMADNCGCGCGCGCAAMVDLNYQEKIVAHYQTKPYSIDPFNELGTPTDVRDGLLVRDFLDSFERLSTSITERVNTRYYQMGRAFSG